MVRIPLLVAAVATLRPFGRAVRPKSAELDLQPDHVLLAQQFQRLTPRCQEQLEGLQRDLMVACQLRESRGHDCNKIVGNIFSGWARPRFFETLAASDKEAMLWAGMWDGAGSEPGRTTKQALFDFADSVDADTVHPSSKLGKMVADHGDLEACNKDPAVYEAFTDSSDNKGLIPNFWNQASKVFVKGMANKKQVSVVIVVNKDLNPQAERSFQKSVLYNYELPELAREVNWSFEDGDPWHPQVVVVDLKGTCDEMLKTMKERIEHTVLNEFWVQKWLKKKPLRCLPCTAPCMLDENFAEKVKKEFNRKWYHFW
ncbi:Rabgap1l [Symbiodinium natans]|uniref:Rabgap1l protein n=1 Tax=Symbiodinium natans TaxID=878477 RepID=A0A812PK35_9DINO|nr:Rabgap1l [Symbiodinium natans]